MSLKRRGWALQKLEGCPQNADSIAAASSIAPAAVASTAITTAFTAAPAAARAGMILTAVMAVAAAEVGCEISG